jgi:hypothetical protein
MPAFAEEQRRLLEVLIRFGVEFVVIGGVGAQALGWRGATLDLDIAVSSDDANVRRLNSAWRPYAPGNRRSGRSARPFRPSTAGWRSSVEPTASAGNPRTQGSNPSPLRFWLSSTVPDLSKRDTLKVAAGWR